MPKVNLEATDKRALETVGLADLKKYAAAGDVEGDAITPDKDGRGSVRESKEIGGQVSTGKSAAVEGPLVAGSRGQN